MIPHPLRRWSRRVVGAGLGLWLGWHAAAWLTDARPTDPPAPPVPPLDERSDPPGLGVQPTIRDTDDPGRDPSDSTQKTADSDAPPPR